MKGMRTLTSSTICKAQLVALFRGGNASEDLAVSFKRAKAMCPVSVKACSSLDFGICELADEGESQEDDNE
jgi:hypothetical protein